MASMDMKVKDILADPATKAIIDQYLPGAADNPLVKMVSGKTLREVCTSSQAKQLGMTPELMANIEKELAKLP